MRGEMTILLAGTVVWLAVYGHALNQRTTADSRWYDWWLAFFLVAWPFVVMVAVLF